MGDASPPFFNDWPDLLLELDHSVMLHAEIVLAEELDTRFCFISVQLGFSLQIVGIEDILSNLIEVQVLDGDFRARADDFDRWLSGRGVGLYLRVSGGWK